MRLTNTVVIFVCLTLGGCASNRHFPVNYTEPTVSNAVGGDLDKAVASARSLRESYKGLAKEKYRDVYKYSDVSYVGYAIGILGGAAQSVEAVASGALIGVTGDTIPSRYQLELQAQNFIAAADTFACIVTIFETKNDTARMMTKHPGWGGFYVNQLRDINYRVFKKQAEIELTRPSLEELGKALADAKAADDKLVSMMNNGALKAGFTQSEVNFAAFNIIFAEINKCRSGHGLQSS